MNKARTKRPALPWILFAVALAAAVVFAVLWAKAVADKGRAEAAERRRAEVTSAATSFLQALTNFSGATIDEDVREIRSFAIGDFAEQVETFFGPRAVAALRQAKARSVGRVESVFVQSLSGETASVFGVVNEAVSNGNSPVPRTEILRVNVEMIETASGWKVDRVDILQSPGGPFPGGG